MSEILNIRSEIGALKKVMLHRPGKEIENLVPQYLDRLLFDDIPYLEAAKSEHDGFAAILSNNGVEVVYLEDLLVESLTEDSQREQFITTFLKESFITSENLRDSLISYLLDMPTTQMVDKLMSGIRKNEVNIKKITSLSEIINSKYPFYIDPMPNLYFTRDPGSVIGAGISINSMNTLARKRESFFLEWIFAKHPLYGTQEIPHWYSKDMTFSIEGGDILVLSSEVVAIGCSERTSSEAIEAMAKRLFESKSGFKKVLVFEIPSCRAFMHLDTVFTMVDYDKFTMHPEIEGTLRVFEITEGSNHQLNFKILNDRLENILSNALGVSDMEILHCGGGDAIISGREQWNDGSNTLAIAPGIVVTYDRNYVTNEILDKKGIKVLTMPSAELSRGRGGPRCMSMPLYRENI